MRAKNPEELTKKGRPCNMGIGLLKDKTEVLLNAAKYLASYFEG